MNLTFDINALRTIVVASKLGNFAKAAKHLGRSQSAVSMQLKKLEEQTGIQLFIRDGKKLVPTEAGQILLEYATRIVTLNDEAAASISTKFSNATVRLGMPQDFAAQILPAVLEQFSQAYPNVHVEVQIGKNYTLAEEVRLGHLDAALIFSAEQKNNFGQFIAQMDMIWVGQASSKVVSEELPVPLICFNFPCEFRKHAIQALDNSNRSWRYTLTTPSLAGIWAAIEADMGVTVRTRYQTPEHFQNLNSLFSLPDLPPIFVHQIEHSTQSPASKELSEILKSVSIEQLASS